MSIDPTVPKEKKLGKTYRFKVWLEKVTKFFWYLFMALVILECLVIAVKLFNKPPKERMCWDRWTCYDYCELAKQKTCLLPEKTDSLTAGQAWKLVLTGKRTVIEVLNDYQKYCACEIEGKDGETRTETFYRFYSENN